MKSTPLIDNHGIENCKKCGGLIWLSQDGVYCEDGPYFWNQHADPFDCIDELRGRLDSHSL